MSATRAGSGRRYVLLIVVGVLVMAIAAYTRGPKVARQVWGRVGMHQVEAHAATIRTAAAESGLDPYLLAALMYAESRGQVDAVSHKGALGLFQLMETSAGDSAKRLGLPRPTREALLSDALLNARLAASHLAWLIEHDGPDLERVLVGYNAGRTKLARWEREAGGWAAWRAARMRAQDSDALTYAQQVLEFAERFRAHGVIAASSPARDAVHAADAARAPAVRDGGADGTRNADGSPPAHAVERAPTGDAERPGDAARTNDAARARDAARIGDAARMSDSGRMRDAERTSDTAPVGATGPP